MGNGEAGAQHGAVRPVKMEKRGWQVIIEPALDTPLDVSPGPRRAEPLALQVQVGDVVEGIDGTQARVELQAVDDSDFGIEPDMLGPQISVPVDDAGFENARFQHAAVLDHEAALDTVDALDENRWKAEARVKQDPAVSRQVLRPSREVCARGKEDRARPPVEPHQCRDQPIKLRGIEAALTQHLLQGPSLIEAAHDDQPVGDRARRRWKGRRQTR